MNIIHHVPIPSWIERLIAAGRWRFTCQPAHVNELSPHLLRDIGLTRPTERREAFEIPSRI